MKHILFCTVLFFALAVFGNAKKIEAKLADVDIGKGKITHVERITDGKFLHYSNKVLKNIPPCTRICYTLTPGKESYIRCELWLPDNWNGRLWGVGNGGIAGNLRTANFDSYMRDGDAVVTTDMGTSNGAVNKPDVWLDFAYRSTHLMTVTAKSLIKAYYGKKVKYSYFTGRSTGGGQALHEAQRYPEDYDGILSEVPVVNRMLLLMIMSYRSELLFDSKGNPVFCEQQVKNLKEAALQFYKDKDEPYAVKRGFLSYPKYSFEDAKKIIDIAAGMKPALTDDQKERLYKIYDGVFANGKRVTAGQPHGKELRMHMPTWLVNYGYYFDPPRKNPKLYTNDKTKAMPHKEAMQFIGKMTPMYRADNPDLRKFSSRGGKIIIMSGVDDRICPESIITDYVNKAVTFAGGMDKFNKFARYYILPGRVHAQAQSRGVRKLAELKKVITAWVENGKAPEVLDGLTADGKTLPVPPYPKRLRGDDGRFFITDDGYISRECVEDDYWQGKSTFSTIYGKVYLPDKRDHIQGICATEKAIYLGCNQNIIKLDWSGKEVKRVPTPNHTGDICVYNGKIYSSVACRDKETKKRYGYIVEYSADLKELSRFKLDIPLDGIAELGGYFYCGVGGMGGKYEGPDKIAKIKADFTGKIEIIDIDCGVPTMFGPQAITSNGRQLFLSYYAKRDLSTVYNADMTLDKVLDFSACLGFESVPGRKDVFMRLLVTEEYKAAPKLQAFRIDFFRYENGKMVNITK